jgi:L-malate glycosyltransferase
MRVLYFTRDYTTHDHRFLSTIAGAGNEVGFLRLERAGDILDRRPLPVGVQDLVWAGTSGPARLMDSWRLLRGLKRVIREFRPDLIHAGPLQRGALLAALTGFRPLISMSWGYDLIRDAGRNILWKAATRLTLRRSTLMIGDCESIKGLAVSHGMSADRIVVFPWGIDVEHFNPVDPDDAAPGSSDPEAFTLISTRGWEAIYGVDVICHAFVEAAHRYPGLRLVMLGTGALEGTVRGILAEGGVEERVVFLGQVAQADLPHFYRSADLYLSAAHSDGTSISLLEAMACGRPVIVSDIPGNKEWVAPGENGWLFPDGDAGALARVIMRAVRKRFDEPGVWTNIGAEARRTVEERGDWRENQRRLLDAYQRAVNET